MEVAVTGGKLKLMQELLIVHDVEGVEDVEAVLFRLEEAVLHEGHRSVLGGHIVQEIS